MQRTRYSVEGAPLVDYPFDLGASAGMQYLPADVPLTAAFVRQFGADALNGVPYAFEATLFLDVATSGTVLIQAGITGGSPEIRLMQISNAGAGTLGSASSGAGNQSVTSASLSITGVRSIVVSGSALKTTADGRLFIDLMNGTAVATLKAGSTFKAYRCGFGG